MTSIGSSGSSSYQRPSLESLFSKLDTNGDKKVSQDEFVAGRPEDVSETQATSMFSQIDSSGNGSVSLADFTAGMQQGGQMSALESDTLLALLQQVSETEGSSSTSGSSKADRLSDLFQKLDTDSDGTVTKDEFVAGRPDDVSEADASALFDKLDTEQTGALGEEAFKEAMLANAPANGPHGPGGPPPGGPPPSASSDDDEDDDDSISAVSSSLEDVLSKLLETLDTDNTTGTSSASSLQELLAAVKSYSTSLGYSNPLYSGSASSSLSSLI